MKELVDIVKKSWEIEAGEGVVEEEVVDFGEVTDANFEATDWTDETHNKSADPDFDEVFDDTQVKRLDF